MNDLETLIRSDIKYCMKEGNKSVMNILKMIIGEIPRLNMKVNVSATDEQVIKIIRKLIKSETQVLEIKNEDIDDSLYISVLNRYIPKMVSDKEIKAYIEYNIDFSSLKNKMQAVGLVTKHFGDTVDGGAVSKIIQRDF